MAQQITGTVTWIKDVVVNGNTVFVFTLMKQTREFLEDDDVMFDATFVVEPNNRGGLNALAVKMLRVEKEARITIEIGNDIEIPLGNSVTSDMRVNVYGVEFANDDGESRAGRPSRRRRTLPL